MDRMVKVDKANRILMAHWAVRISHQVGCVEGSCDTHGL
jgi:hypothetical protein